VNLELAELMGTSGLLRVAHKTITLVQPQAFPFARRPFELLRDRQ